MNDSFLHEVVRSLPNQNWEEMCFIVPNKRSALYLTQSVISQLEEPTIAPEILDIDSFIRSLSNMEAPPKMELLFDLYHSYCQHVLIKQLIFLDQVHYSSFEPKFPNNLI